MVDEITIDKGELLTVRLDRTEGKLYVYNSRGDRSEVDYVDKPAGVIALKRPIRILNDYHIGIRASPEVLDRVMQMELEAIEIREKIKQEKMEQDILRDYEKAVVENRTYISKLRYSPILQARQICNYLHRNRYQRWDIWGDYCPVCYRAISRLYQEHPEIFTPYLSGYILPTDITLKYIMEETEKEEERIRTVKKEIFDKAMMTEVTDISDAPLPVEVKKQIAMELARLTNKNIVYALKTARCITPNIECNVDIIEVSVTPEGTEIRRRIHTY